MNTVNKLTACFLAALLIFSFAAGNFFTYAEGVTVSKEYDADDLDIAVDSSVTDAAIGQTLDIKAKSAVLMEPYTGKVLYESNPDEVLPPASITKIMSLLLVMEAIERGDMSTEDVVTASEHACSMGGSQIWLEPGETMTVDDLLKAAVIASANDATVVLGETIAGSEEGFVAMMNEKAKKLGMTNTVFMNCTGLDAQGHHSTAHDVAVMSSELIKYPLIKKYSTVWMDSLRDGKSELVNTNKLVRFYKGTTGLKTGTTSGAGYCLSATAKRGDLELVAVIMGGDTSPDRFNGAKKLLDYGFANYSFTNVIPKIKEGTSIKVKNGTAQSVDAVCSETFGALLKKTDAAKISQKITLKKEVAAPVKKGDVIGSIDIYSDNNQIGSLPVRADKDVPKISFKITFGWLVRGMFTP